MKRCARCGEDKPVDQFGWKDKDTGKRTSYCKPCARAHSKEHYAANKTAYLVRTRRNKRRQRANRMHWLVTYLESNPCVDCGETDPLVLEFDHLRDKKFDLGREFGSKPWSEVLAEIEKCDVVCANCHRRRTATRGGFLRVTLGET